MGGVIDCKSITYSNYTKSNHKTKNLVVGFFCLTFNENSVYEN